MAEDKKQNGGNRGVGLHGNQINGSIGEMIARHVVQMSEHVSSIQVVATKLESDGTTTRFAYGSGDMFARVKSMEVFAEQVEEELL